MVRAPFKLSLGVRGSNPLSVLISYMEDDIEIKITNCCYFRGGGKGWNRKPYRIRKYQNYGFTMNRQLAEKLTDKEILDRVNRRHHNIWTMSTSKVKRKL